MPRRKLSTRQRGWRPAPVTLLSLLLGLIFLMAGGLKLAGSPVQEAMFRTWGYPLWFMVFVGFYEFAAGVMILHPRSAFYAATMIAIEMIAAVFTHMRVDQTVMIAVPLTTLFFAGVVWWWRRPELVETRPLRRPTAA